MRVLFEIETSKVRLIWRAPSAERKTLDDIGQVPGVLNVEARRNDVAFERIIPQPPDEAPRFFEETDYRLFLKSKSGHQVSIEHADPVTCAGLTNEDGSSIVTGVINFHSNVGLSRFTVLVDNKPEFDFVIEVFPTKLDYKSDYELLLAETRWHIAGLVFEFLRPTFRFAKPTRQKESDDLSWLFVLREIIEQLEFAARFIARRPIRALVREDRLTNIEKVKRIDSSVRTAIRKGAGAGSFTNIEEIPIKQKIVHRTGSFTLDTAEHRWIAFQLRAIRHRLHGLIDTESRPNPQWGKASDKSSANARKAAVLDSIRAIATRVQALEKLEPFEAVTVAPPAGYASLQLMSAPGYRECYQLLTLLRYGLDLDFGILQLSVKEISTLYEYWCFLTLVSMIGQETGASIEAGALIKTSKSGLGLNLRKGETSKVPFTLSDGRKITVTFNERFEQSDDTILIPQKPDIMVTIEVVGWPKLSLLFDAKYRIRCDERILALYKSPGPDEDAINCLHRYRDAILEMEHLQADERPKRTVIQAAAIFPYRDSSGSFSDSRLWRSLEKIGVGAIPLLPTEKRYMKQWLATVLHAGEWSLADKAINHTVIEKREDWRRAASEAVLMGIIPGENPQQRLQWLRDNMCYYMPLRQRNPRQFSVKRVCIYESFAHGGLGAVMLAADVVDIEIVERSEIVTPWAARDRSKQRCVLYRLENLRKLDRAIRNIDSARVSTERWTSRLSLERATTLSELLLETEPEWRLYESLKNERINFKVRAGRIRPLYEEGSTRRTVFVLDDGREIVYAGPDGFVISDVDKEIDCPNEEGVVAELVKQAERLKNSV